ncbi:uncharacterized protein [Branchiostoma lanceolatum]|uniref:uncharacterized protein n=1 Tax=Branchiostoma lanceolatum TaxID=7740 RepID=UPI0034547394
MPPKKPKSAPKKGKKRPSEEMDKDTSFTQEESIVEFFAAHPEFYDKTRDDYRNSGKKNRLLQEKSKELGITAKDITSWYSTTRSTFCRMKKQKSGQAPVYKTARQRWIWQNCQFFMQHIVHRAAHTTVLGQVRPQESQSTSHADSEDSAQDEDEAPEGSVSATASTSASTSMGNELEASNTVSSQVEESNNSSISNPNPNSNPTLPMKVPKRTPRK